MKTLQSLDFSWSSLLCLTSIIYLFSNGVEEPMEEPTPEQEPEPEPEPKLEEVKQEDEKVLEEMEEKAPSPAPADSPANTQEPPKVRGPRHAGMLLWIFAVVTKI